MTENQTARNDHLSFLKCDQYQGDRCTYMVNLLYGNEEKIDLNRCNEVNTNIFSEAIYTH